MMKHITLLFVLITAIMLTGCRSDEDRMAEFCLGFDSIAENSKDCAEMANNLNEMLSRQQPKLKNKKLCENSTACLPCKHGARIILSQCGTDPEMRPVLDKMNFSKALREL